MNGEPQAAEPLRIEKAVYGGDGLARTGAGEVIFVPYTLPGEQVTWVRDSPEPEASATQPQPTPLQVLEPSPDRVSPRCVHFGVCGGCQYQMAAYPAQLAIKRAILRETLQRAGVEAPGPAGDPGAELTSWPSPEEYGYRNRIRLRTRALDGTLQVGYSIRGTREFLPVTMCPIAAPLLWRAVDALLTASEDDRDLYRWLRAAAEIELFTDGEQHKLQLSLLLPGGAPFGQNSFVCAMETVRTRLPELTGAGALRADPRSGRSVETLAAWGAAGLPYAIADETYWITRGGFFQVNRFLLPMLLDLVCGDRSGALAWDLFAGVGLFSRRLARQFAAVTAVEANPTAAGDLKRALSRIGPQHQAVQATTLDFLRRAVLERARPDLIVLDPPRAGAGEEVCNLLLRLRPAGIAYLSCDPTTLARDLAQLTRSGYRIAALHLIDLFPQTYHLETLAILRHTSSPA